MRKKEKEMEERGKNGKRCVKILVIERKKTKEK